MLTPDQQSTLDYHLRETNLLTNEELILELTDHYTTALETQLAEGIPFEATLTTIQAAFGGRKGLQKMERDYNRVTFRHYDERWRQALLAQFQKPLLWRQTVPAYAILLLVSYILFLPSPKTGATTGPKWESFYDGFLPGIFIGFVWVLISLLWPYLKTTLHRGFHNVPTEVLYLMKRQGLGILVLYGAGIPGYFRLLPLLPAPIQAVLVATYLAGVGLFILTSHFMHELLYEYEPGR